MCWFLNSVSTFIKCLLWFRRGPCSRRIYKHKSLHLNFFGVIVIYFLYRYFHDPSSFSPVSPIFSSPNNTVSFRVSWDTKCFVKYHVFWVYIQIPWGQELPMWPLYVLFTEEIQIMSTNDSLVFSMKPLPGKL